MYNRLTKSAGRNDNVLQLKRSKFKVLSLTVILLSLLSYFQTTAQIVINEVDRNGTVELINNGPASVDISNYWLCNFPAYTQLSNLTLDCGSLTIGAGEITTISGFTSISGTDAEVGLYSSSAFSSSAALVDYLEWGFSGHQRSALAASAGVWTAGEFIPTFPSNESISFDGSGDTAADYAAGSNSFCSPNTTTTPPPATTELFINEVIANGYIEIINNGTTTIDISGYWFCNFPTYTQLSSLTVECGSLNIAPGEITGISGFASINPNDAELGLYNSNSFGSAAALEDYIEWGSTGHQRSALAVSAGVWSSAQFIPSFTANESISFDGDGNTAADYSIGAPSFCSPNGAINGGTLTGGPFTFCIDGVADNIPNGAITLAGNLGSNNQIVVTDDQGNILGLPPTFSAPDFDAAGEGTCLVWNLAYEDGLQGLQNGSSINNLVGNFSFSNSITVYRNAPDGGSVTLVGGGTEFAMCAGDIVFDVEHTTTAEFLSFWYIITDENNNILGFENSANTNTLDLSAAPAGTCRVWGWSYRGLPDPVIGDPLSTLMDDTCEEISTDFITVYREIPDGGTVTLLGGGTEYTGTAGDIVFQVEHSTTAPNLSYWYIITDENGLILGFVNSANSNTLDLSAAPAGVCRVWGWNYRGLDDPIVGDPISTLMDDFCEDISEEFITVNRLDGSVCNADGGTLVGGPFTFCVDGVADNIPDGAITLSGYSGTNTQIVVTDDQGNILGLPPTFSAPDFDAAGEGTCFVYNLAYEDGLLGLEAGANISNFEGCYSLSNAITVYRNAPDGGTVTLVGGGTEFAMCAGDIVFDVEHTTTAEFLSFWYIITDENNNILGFENSANTNTLDLSAAPAGTCRVWGWSYRGLPDPVIGDPLSTLMDDTCEDISDSFITVYREIPDGGTVTLLGGGTEYTGSAGNIVFQVEHTTTAPNLSYWYIITDENGLILGFVNSANSNTLDLSAAPAGVCRVWGWNYRGLGDPIIGEPISTLMDDFCEDISEDFITVNRLDNVNTEIFTATLTGSQELPCPVVTAAYGNINAELNGNMLSVSGSFTNLAGDFDASIAEGSHIHFAPAGRNGGVEFILAPTLDPDLRGGTYAASDNTFELTDAQITYLRNGELYINIHTLFSAPGELRGQLLPPADYTLQANLSGLNEVPAINSSASGNVLLQINGNELTASGSFEGVNSGVNTALAGGAHIHVGSAGINGPIVFLLDLSLSADSTSAVITPENNTFTITNGQRDTLLAGGNYINVHSLENAPGELRGQIVNTASISFVADLNGANEVPANDSEATGRIQVDYNAFTQEIAVSGSFSNFTSALNLELAGGAHIHIGAPTENGPILFPFVANTDADLFNGTFTPANNTFAVSPEDVALLFSEGLYVNMHSIDNAPGEIRGQLLPLTCRALCDVDGGTLEGGPFTFCVDGVADNIPNGAITLSGYSGANTQIVVTDDQGYILGLPPTFSAPDFDAAGEGTCFVYNLAYEDGLLGLEAGANISNFDGCYSLSNAITVYRNAPDGGTVTLVGGGTEFAMCAGDIVFDVEHTTTAEFLSFWYIITDENNNILGFENSANTNTLDLSAAPAGTCRVWGWSYRGLPDPVIGDPLSTLMDDTCEDISDSFITIYREIPDGGTVTLLGGGTEYSGTAGDIVFQVEHTTTAPNLSYWYIITDENGLILGFVNSANSNTLDLSAAPAGVCRVWGWNYRGLGDPIVGDPISTLTDDFCEDISEEFITVNRLPANNDTGVDLELSLAVDNNLYEQFENVRYTFTVTNTGSESATNIEIDATYPSGLVFVSEHSTEGFFDLSAQSWIIPYLAPGATATLDLTLFTLVENQRIEFFTQVIAVDQIDSDSTPDSSNGQVTEDDEASVTITPRGAGGFGSNEGNNDLELSISTQSTTYDIYEVVRYRIEVQNLGTETATGVVVSAGLPEGMVFTNATVNNGEYNLFFEEWTIDFIGAGTTATLDLDLFTLVEGQDITNFVEILVANELDPDSTPGNSNGLVNEDDEASVTLTFSNNANTESTLQERSILSKMMDIQSPFPNPASSFVMVPIESEIDLQTELQILDINGRVVETRVVKIFEGFNRLNITTEEYSPGVYFISFSDLESSISTRKFVKTHSN